MGPGDHPPAILETEDPVLGTIWRLVTYTDGEAGWTYLDVMAYEPSDELIGGGGACDPNFPPSLPTVGTATVGDGATGTSLAVLAEPGLPAADLWYGSAWGRVNCDDCDVVVTWVGGARTAATVKGGYWLAYHPMPIDIEDSYIEAVTVEE